MTERSIERRSKVPEIRKGDVVDRVRQGRRQARQGHPRDPPQRVADARPLRLPPHVAERCVRGGRRAQHRAQAHQAAPALGRRHRVSAHRRSRWHPRRHAPPGEPGDGRLQPLRRRPTRSVTYRELEEFMRASGRTASGCEGVSGQLKERYAAGGRSPRCASRWLRQPDAGALEKIVVNIGLGEALSNAKAVDAAVGDVGWITGQKPIVTRAKRSIAPVPRPDRQPDAREGDPPRRADVGLIERLAPISTCRRIRDFRAGRSTAAATTHWPPGASPEIDYDKVDRLRGWRSASVTTGEDRREIEAPPQAPRHALRRVGRGEESRWPRSQ